MLDDEQSKKFLADSGYRTVRKQMLCSCNLRTFYEFLETFLPSAGVQPKIKTEDQPVKFYKSDDDFLEDFLAIFQDELKDVSV